MHKPGRIRRILESLANRCVPRVRVDGVSVYPHGGARSCSSCKFNLLEKKFFVVHRLVFSCACAS